MHKTEPRSGLGRRAALPHVLPAALTFLIGPRTLPRVHRVAFTAVPTPILRDEGVFRRKLMIPLAAGLTGITMRTVTNAVESILARRAPGEVRQDVVIWNIIQVSTHHPWWARADKRFEHHMMHQQTVINLPSADSAGKLDAPTAIGPLPLLEDLPAYLDVDDASSLKTLDYTRY
jgi:hypothetical protein